MKNDEFFSFDEKDGVPPIEDSGADTEKKDTGDKKEQDTAFFMPPIGEDGQLRMPHGEMGEPPVKSNLPLTSLILAVLSFCCCGLPLSITAIICAIISKRKLGRWDGLAVAGIIVALLCLLMNILVLFVLFSGDLLLGYEDTLSSSLLSLLS